jgi:hypothetical protein
MRLFAESRRHAMWATERAPSFRVFRGCHWAAHRMSHNVTRSALWCDAENLRSVRRT